MNPQRPVLEQPANKPTVIKSVCVYCASSTGNDPVYVQEAEKLGELLAKNNIRLVYGGGSVGLMGAVAKGVLNNGGKTFGVVPEVFYKHGSKQPGDFKVVPDMHTRKKIMADESDAFIVLPGGYGTMEEMFEMITWSQLNIHSKPILLLNTKKFFDLCIQWIEQAAEAKFISEGNTKIFVSCDTTESVLERLKDYSAPSSRYGFNWAVNKDLA
ncbi:hypothetical protein BY458DRAFT_452353 [Sporodiniella umbellata]|nr:hypothetical protein BY458DRAFT_452353 [Sporodiniella umbellata]